MLSFWRKYYRWPWQQTCSNEKPGQSILELGGFLNQRWYCELGQHIENHKACYVITKCACSFIINPAKLKGLILYVAPLKTANYFSASWMLTKWKAHLLSYNVISNQQDDTFNLLRKVISLSVIQHPFHEKLRWLRLTLPGSCVPWKLCPWTNTTIEFTLISIDYAQ